MKAKESEELIEAPATTF